MSHFVCGADVTYKGAVKFAVDVMGRFDNVDDAVKARKDLHSSFDYAIYEVETAVTSGLRRTFGFNQGKSCSGYRIISKVCAAYNHPAWNS